MKKIIPFLLFLPLILFSIYLGFTQFQNKKTASTTVINTIGSRQIQMFTPTDTPKTIPTLPSQTINLTISAPISGSTVDAVTIVVSGSTEPNATVVINDAEVTASVNGKFQTNVLLDEGDNYISIVAYNDFGNVAEREILVTRTVSGL